MPTIAAFDPRLTAEDCRVLTALCAAQQNLHGWIEPPGTSKIAAMVHMSKPTVIKALHRLRDTDWIEVRHRTDAHGADIAPLIRINTNNTVPGLEDDGGGSIRFTGRVNEFDRLVETGTPLPADFPTAELIAEAAAAYPHLPIHKVVDDFRRYHTRRAHKREDWPKAWDVWVRKAEKDYPHERHGQGSRALPGSADAKRRAGIARLAEAAAEHELR